MKRHLIIALLVVSVTLLAPGCKSEEAGAESSAAGTESSPEDDDKTASIRGENDDESAGRIGDPLIDRDYPNLKATYDGEPVEIRAAIAFEWEHTNSAGTPEGAKRVHLFTLPTNCKNGMKTFTGDGIDGAYVIYQFQLGEATISKTGGGEPAGGMGSTGFDGIDFSKIDTSPGAETTIEIHGADEPSEGMRGNPWSVTGTVTVVGCGERK